MNQAVGFNVTGNWLAHAGGGTYLRYRRETDITSPSPADLFVFTDEFPGSLNDGGFAVCMTEPGTLWITRPTTIIWPARSPSQMDTWKSTNGRIGI